MKLGTKDLRALGPDTWRKLDLEQIAEEHSTPLYITDRLRLLENLEMFIDLLGSSEHVLFPVKTSPCLAALKILADRGCGADCACERELQLARLAGVETTRLSYYSPATDIPLAVNLLREGGSVIIDAPSKLEAIENILGNTSFSGKLFLRVNPALKDSYDNQADYQTLTSHADPTSQFGLPIGGAVQLLQSTRLAFTGLHVHVGTLMDNVEVFKASLDILHQLCEEIHSETTHKILHINLGGGLGAPMLRKQNFPTVEQLRDAVRPKLNALYTYKMEPGNALFGDATALLTRVETRKSSNGKEWAIVDVGTDQLVKVTLAGFGQEILGPQGIPLESEGSDSVAGPLCFAGDVLLPGTDLSSVSEGDLLILPNAGAYCRSVSNHFNGCSQPGTLLTDGTEIIGLVYGHEDSFYEPVVQSYRPEVLQPTTSYAEKVIPDDQVEKIRSHYLRDQCAEDSYSFHNVRKIADGHYELKVKTKSAVPFISAPLVMRIISDATIVAMIDLLGHTKKEISVWGSRFNVSLDTIVRANRQQTLTIRILPQMNSSNKENKEFLAYWQLGEGSHGSIQVVV